MSTYAEQIGDYAAQLEFDDLPEQVIQYAKWSILDSIGVAIASFDTPWSRAAYRVIQKQGGSPESTVFFYGDRFPDANAALVNSMFVHSMDYNDDLSGIQVGAVMPPTAIATAEPLSASGKEVITAVVVGYDVASRVASAVNSQELYLRGFQPTAVLGQFAAAAVASKILHLSPEQSASAFGIAGSYAGGTIEFLDDGTDTKRFHVAKASYGGIMSAHLASEGMTGPKRVFEGRNGILRALSKDPNPARLVEELGSRFDILDTSFKWYPFCDGGFCPLEAALDIVQENGLTLEEIARYHFKVKSFLIPYLTDYYGDTERKYRPKTEMDAQMSLPYTLAVGLLRKGDVRLEDFDRRSYSNPEILQIADKVTAEADPELDKVPFRPMSMPTIATITTKDGRVFTKRVDFQKGDPRNPFSEDDFIEKFSKNVEGKLTNEYRTKLLESVWTLESLPDIRQLTKYAVKQAV
jgi:2-methylcitrate dehydratase PrpD